MKDCIWLYIHELVLLSTSAMVCIWYQFWEYKFDYICISTCINFYKCPVSISQSIHYRFDVSRAWRMYLVSKIHLYIHQICSDVSWPQSSLAKEEEKKTTKEDKEGGRGRGRKGGARFINVDLVSSQVMKPPCPWSSLVASNRIEKNSDVKRILY